MKYLRSIVAWFESLETDKPFQKWMPIILKSWGVVAYVFTLLMSVMFVVSVILQRLDSMSSLLFYSVGSILIAFSTIAGGTVIIMLIWNRSNKINILHDESDFTLLNITVILIRLLGEVALIVIFTTGFHGLVSGVFGIGIPGVISFLFNPFDNDLSMSIDLGMGIISIIVSTINGIIILISSYIIAALLNLVVGMAKNLRNIDATLSTEETMSDS